MTKREQELLEIIKENKNCNFLAIYNYKTNSQTINGKNIKPSQLAGAEEAFIR